MAITDPQIIAFSNERARTIADQIARLHYVIEAWLLEYAAAAQPFATCRLLGHLGATTMDDEIARVVQTHDTATRATSSLPLA